MNLSPHKAAILPTFQYNHVYKVMMVRYGDDCEAAPLIYAQYAPALTSRLFA